MRYFLLVLALAWLVALPPFFTNGACDAEFDRQRAEFSANRSAFSSPELARRYWQSKAIPVRVLSAEQCRHAVLKFVDACGPGSLVYVAVPVRNRICKYYRDDSITVQFAYDERGNLARTETDMDPFKSLAVPFLAKTLEWGR